MGGTREKIPIVPAGLEFPVSRSISNLPMGFPPFYLLLTPLGEETKEHRNLDSIVPQPFDDPISHFPQTMVL